MKEGWWSAYGFSIGIHVVLVAILVVGAMRSSPPTPAPVSASQPIAATAVDAAKVEQELERLRAEERQQAAREAAKRQAIIEEKRRAEAARKREEQRLAAVKRQRVEEEQRRKAEASRLARIKAEQQALEEKRRIEQARLAEQERQRKIEAEKRREAEEAAKKAEAERLRAEQAARERAEREAALKKALAAENQRLQADRDRQLVSARTEYVNLIAGKVGRYWLRPSDTPDDFSCKVLVSQIPGGEVVGVQVLESCGSAALDRSVEAAVRKASPLPKPPDSEVFDREIEFTFIPRR